MVDIRFFKNRSGRYSGFESKGHAGEEEEGSNIFCAAVSAMTQMAVIGLTEVTSSKPKVVMESGYLKATVKKELAENENCQTIFKTLILGLRSFQLENPGYIQILEEVQ